MVCTGFHHRVLFYSGYGLVYHFSVRKSIHNFRKQLKSAFLMDLIFKSFKYKFPILLSLLQMLFAYTLPGTVFRNIIQYHIV